MNYLNTSVCTMLRKVGILLLTYLSFFVLDVKSQGFKIKNYQLGYRIFEISSVGNNPTNISPLLKDPVTYDNFLNTFSYNSLYGHPGIIQLHTIYLNTEWQKVNPLLKFWREITVQTGLLLTTPFSIDAGAIGNLNYPMSPDSARRSDHYVLTKRQQFFGANLGINKRLKISDNFNFFVGLHTQGSFAVVHHYKQALDSSSYSPSTGWIMKITPMPNLPGKNFFQWQLMVPLGFEYTFRKKRLGIRLEADAGIVGSKYRPNSSSDKEAHGAGIWLLYKPASRK